MNSGSSPQSPVASILISNYNYAQFLREAIDSALRQTYPYTEVIVVDDGSTDRSRDIIASYGNRVVPVFKENGGQASAINAGFSASRGEIICLLDSDDLFLPEKVARVLNAWERNPHSCVVYHQLQAVDAQGQKKIGNPWPQAVWCGDIRDRVERSGGWWAYPTTSGLCFSRSYMQQLLPIPTETTRGGSDTYLAGPAAFVAPVIGVAAVLGMVRFHGQQPVPQGSSAYHFKQACFEAGNESTKRLSLFRNKIKRYTVEFAVLKETLRERLNTPASISLEDVWPYQRCRWAAGEPVTWPEAVAGVIGCPTLPLSMKWKEVAKAVLHIRDWRCDRSLATVSVSKRTSCH